MKDFETYLKEKARIAQKNIPILSQVGYGLLRFSEEGFYYCTFR